MSVPPGSVQHFNAVTTTSRQTATLPAIRFHVLQLQMAHLVDRYSL
jgi:hypothetical protein